MASGSRTKIRQTKAEQSRETKRRIVAAATTLFVRDGFLSTTMAAIAAEAQVAVQTLYLSFGNKTAILKAAFDEAIAGDDDPTPLPERAWFHYIVENRDGAAALATFVEHSSELQRRVNGLYSVIRAAAADPEIAELLATNKKERLAGFRVIMSALATRDGFTTALTVNEAIALVYTTQSEETYALMVDEAGATFEQWRSWVLRTLLRELFADR